MHSYEFCINVFVLVREVYKSDTCLYSPVLEMVYMGPTLLLLLPVLSSVHLADDDKWQHEGTQIFLGQFLRELLRQPNQTLFEANVEDFDVHQTVRQWKRHAGRYDTVKRGKAQGRLVLLLYIYIYFEN